MAMGLLSRVSSLSAAASTYSLQVWQRTCNQPSPGKAPQLWPISGCQDEYSVSGQMP